MAIKFKEGLHTIDFKFKWKKAALVTNNLAANVSPALKQHPLFLTVQ
jgi:hypothetical protein